MLRRRELGEEHTETLESIKNLGILYHDQRRNPVQWGPRTLQK